MKGSEDAKVAWLASLEVGNDWDALAAGFPVATVAGASVASAMTVSEDAAKARWLAGLDVSSGWGEPPMPIVRSASACPHAGLRSLKSAGTPLPRVSRPP